MRVKSDTLRSFGQHTSIYPIIYQHPKTTFKYQSSGCEVGRWIENCFFPPPQICMYYTPAEWTYVFLSYWHAKPQRFAIAVLATAYKFIKLPIIITPFLNFYFSQLESECFRKQADNKPCRSFHRICEY